MNIATTGAMEIQSLSPKPAGPLTSRCVAHTAIIHIIMPIPEVAWLTLNHLSAQSTTLARGWDEESFWSVVKQSVAWGGGEMPTRLLP